MGPPGNGRPERAVAESIHGMVGPPHLGSASAAEAGCCGAFGRSRDFATARERLPIGPLPGHLPGTGHLNARPRLNASPVRACASEHYFPGRHGRQSSRLVPAAWRGPKTLSCRLRSPICTPWAPRTSTEYFPVSPPASRPGPAGLAPRLSDHGHGPPRSRPVPLSAAPARSRGPLMPGQHQLGSRPIAEPFPHHDLQAGVGILHRRRRGVLNPRAAPAARAVTINVIGSIPLTSFTRSRTITLQQPAAD